MNQLSEPASYQRLYDILGQHDPAECHGLLCGLLCTDEALARDTWLQQINAEYDPSDSTLLQTLFSSTYQQLQHDDFIFQLLLPDDEIELPDIPDLLGPAQPAADEDARLGQDMAW